MIYTSLFLLLLFLAKQIFSASSLVIHLLDLFRVPLKNTFDTFFSYIVENKIDEVLSDDENIIHIIHALRGIYLRLNERIFIRFILDIIFPNDAQDNG